MEKIMKNKFGFTLAEVLITLAILGVVAAISIPNVMHKIQDSQQMTGFKRAYSMLDNALQMLYVVEGLPSTWPDWPSTEEFNNDNANYFAQKLSKYLALQKFCGSTSGCFSYGNRIKATDNNTYYTFKGLNGLMNNYSYYAESQHHGKMILKNNMRISLSSRYANHYTVPSRCLGIIRVDINGEKGPNRYGYDVFFFAFDEKGIQTNPGYYCLTSGGSATTHSNACNKDSNGVSGLGRSCSIWIMKHNNMDYKYRDVSAEW